MKTSPIPEDALAAVRGQTARFVLVETNDFVVHVKLPFGDTRDRKAVLKDIIKDLVAQL